MFKDFYKSNSQTWEIADGSISVLILPMGKAIVACISELGNRLEDKKRTAFLYNPFHLRAEQSFYLASQ